MIRCLAIDDEPLALRQLASYIQKVPYLQLVAECQSAIEARQIIDQDGVDAIFCDINMPDLNGLDFVRSLNAPPIIVFTTAYADYAVEGYKVDAVDYLLKPFGLDEFQRAAQRVKRQYDLENQQYEPHVGTDSRACQMPQDCPSGQDNPNDTDADTLFLKTEYRIVKVSISDIRYVEAMSEYLKVHLESEDKPIITLLSMKKMEERLPDYFMRIHRSYIINLTKIQEVNKNRVIMDSDTYLPIGDMYREVFQTYLDTKFLGK
jgi:DNA-binding LytR/AlgR family response regulator